MSPLRLARAAFLAPRCEDCNGDARHRPDYATNLCDSCARRRSRTRLHALDGTGGPESPDAGVALYELWLYSSDEHGRLRGGHGVTMRVRARPGRAWSSSHGGTIGDPQVDPAERLLRGAKLEPLEAELLRRQAAGEPRAAIATVLGLTLSQLERRVTAANRKLAEYALVLRQMAIG